jgi:hypothetical protein
VKPITKKEVKAAVAKLKEKAPDAFDPTGSPGNGPSGGKLSSKKSSMRIRKQGV